MSPRPCLLLRPAKILYRRNIRATPMEKFLSKQGGTGSTPYYARLEEAAIPEYRLAAFIQYTYLPGYVARSRWCHSEIPDGRPSATALYTGRRT